jgi:Protein of unknown function (DUF3616)
MRKRLINLKFNPNYYIGKDVRDGLSATVKTGEYLWLAGDETAHLERLKLVGDDLYAAHQTFSLHNFLPLPDLETEIDIEGLDYQGHYLWLTGSHSLKRKKPRPDGDKQEKEINRLTKVVSEANRYVVARIPVLRNPDTGEFELRKTAPNPEHKQRNLTAGMIPITKNGNELFDALQKDEHLQAFCQIPGKDNGFDIEGLAVYNDRIFLGLRGPVLRGWAIILEIEFENDSEENLKLKKKDNLKYRKHFIHLNGMGVRELCVQGQDMLILAGATMDLDATIAVYRWKNAFMHDSAELVKAQDVERLFDVPNGFGLNTGKDKAEGMTLLSKNELLVVFDSPADIRKTALSEVIADVYEV